MTWIFSTLEVSVLAGRCQSAIDRLTSGAHTLIIGGPTYRQRDQLNQRAAVDTDNEAHNAH